MGDAEPSICICITTGTDIWWEQAGDIASMVCPQMQSLAPAPASPLAQTPVWQEWAGSPAPKPQYTHECRTWHHTDSLHAPTPTLAMWWNNVCLPCKSHPNCNPDHIATRDPSDTCLLNIAGPPTHLHAVSMGDVVRRGRTLGKYLFFHIALHCHIYDHKL